MLFVPLKKILDPLLDRTFGNIENLVNKKRFQTTTKISSRTTGSKAATHDTRA